MASMRQMLVWGSLCVTTLHAARQTDYGQISLHRSSKEDPCEPSCSIMSPKIFWQLVRTPEKLFAKADENCASPKCQGCRRTDADKFRTSTMPDCSAPVEMIQPAQQQEVAQTSQVTPEEDRETLSEKQSEDISVLPEQQPQDIPLAKQTDLCMSKAKPDEVCDYANTAWCLAPSRNVGDTCRKDGKPLCCSKLTVIAAREAAAPEPETEQEDQKAASLGGSESTPEVASATEDNAATAPDLPVEDEGDVCADGEFAFESIFRRGGAVQVCRNTVSKRFAKKICCNDRLKKELAEKEAAINACAEYFERDNNHCRGDRFEKKRSKTRYTKVPLSYTCKVQYLCKDAGGEITFGPVPKQADCGDRELTGHSTCVAVKK
jgi:hypothetical protein